MKNLLNDTDILWLYEHTNLFIDKKLSREQVISTFKIFTDLGVSPQSLSIDSENVILDEHGLQRRIPLIDIYNFAEKLTKLKKYKGFHVLSQSLSNSTQFVDTMFEIDCIFAASINLYVKEIELSPEVKVNGKIKRPDFRVALNTGLEVFCECKSIASVHRINNSKVMRLIKQLDPHVHSIISNKFRVEIVITNLPQHWNRNFSDQLMAAIKVLVEQNYLDQPLTLKFNSNQVIQIKLCHLDDRPYFNCSINIGNKPPLERPTLVIGETPNLKKDIKTSIKDATSQLPDNKASIIYIYSLNETYAKQAIQDFFQDNYNEKLMGIFSCTKNLNFYSNPKCNLIMTNGMIDELILNYNQTFII